MAKDTEDTSMIGHLWNCEHAFELRCSRTWDALQASDDPGIRFCDQCKETVTMCDSPEEFVRLGNLGKCVATPDACFPSTVAMASMGRPSAAHVAKLEREKEECFDWWSKCQELEPKFSPKAMAAIATEHALHKRFRDHEEGKMRQVKSCGILCLYDGRALLMKHRDRYDLPKGHLDEGESETDCALRELNEETGISRGQLEFDDSFRFSTTYYPRYKRFGNKKVEKSVILFLAILKENIEPVLTEHAGYEWVELNFRCSNDTVNELLEEVQAHLA